MNYLHRFLLFFILLTSQLINAQDSIQLFNHKNLEGWYAYDSGSGKHLNALDIFTVENQMIRLYGNNAGYLMSEQSFHNFQLVVEYRWNIDTTFIRKSENKNSGVMYHVASDSLDKLWPKGIQFQIKEGATGDFILLHEVTIEKNGERTEPGKSVVVKRIEDATNSIGEWNRIVITSVNGVIKQELNGKIVNKGTHPSIIDGRILLQYEGFPIDFRKVEIKSLK